MEWPWQYNFPPFFTLQPNEETRRKQMEAWCDLILNYCKTNRIFRINLAEAQTNELFQNSKIDRKCPLEMIISIIDELVKRGRAEWIAENRTGAKSTTSPPKSSSSNKLLATQQQPQLCFILWHTYDEWARLVYDYVSRNSMQNTVCTLYELTEADEVKREKFYKLDKHIMLKCLNVLNAQKKAEVFQSGDDSSSDYGVKFF